MVRLALFFLALLVGCDGSTPAPLPVGAMPSPASQPEDDRLTEARTKLARLEAHRAEIQRLVDRTSDERDRLVAQLHELGVKSSADLKGNPQAASYAQRLQRTALELQSLQRDAAHFDMAIHQAKELIRRLERSSALEGFDDDLATVAEQVMQLDESLGDATPLNPIQQAAILDQELQRQAAPNASSTPVPGDPAARLIGRWEILKIGYGGDKSYLEFTRQGSVIWGVGSELRHMKIGKYSLHKLQLTLTDKRGRSSVYALEFGMDGKSVLMREEHESDSDFDEFDGRWTRIQ